MKESDLTEYVRRDLESLGYTTYAEVCFKGGGDIRCDMYAQGQNPNNEYFGQTILFEAKLSFNLKVIEQAYHWKMINAAHMFYVIVPSSNHKDLKSRKFAREICRLLGIGVMEVNIKSGTYQITVKPTFCSNPKIPTLYEDSQNIIASNNNNNYITPFKNTIKCIKYYMINKDKVLLTELVKNIKHHYKSDIKACRNIKIHIENNVISDFLITKENNRIMINNI